MKKFNSFVILGLSYLVMSLSVIPEPLQAAGLETQAPCTPESAKNTPGKWTMKASKYVNSRQSPSLLKKLEAQAELLHKALGEPPVGFNAHGFIDFPEPSTSKKPQHSHVGALLYQYYCDNGKLKVDNEHDEAWIASNPEREGLYAGDGPFKIGNKDFYLLGSPIGEFRGYPAFEWDWTQKFSGGGTAIFTWSVLVTKKGKPLFYYANRKEILDDLSQVVEKQRPVHRAGCDYMPIRPPEVQAAEKQKELSSFLTGAKDDAIRKKWTDRFNKDYRTDQQKLEECKQKMTALDDKTAARLETVRARYSPNELMQKAYVFKWLIGYDKQFNEDDFDFDFPKTDPDCRPADYHAKNCDTHHMGKPFVLSQSDYFDPNLPNTSPQYFMVGIQWKAFKSTKFHNETSEKTRDDFFARFDFDQLAGMLEK